MAASGLTDAAISHRLNISAATVKTYWARIRTKLGRSSRTELVAHVLRAEAERTACALREVASPGAKEARAQCGYYRLLIEHAPDAMLVLDADAVVRVVNDAVCDLFGYAESELLGQHLSLLVPLRFRQSHASKVADYLLHPTRHAMADHIETFGLHKLGMEIPIAANLSVANTGDRTSVICVVRPLHLTK